MSKEGKEQVAPIRLKSQLTYRDQAQRPPETYREERTCGRVQEQKRERVGKRKLSRRDSACHEKEDYQWVGTVASA